MRKQGSSREFLLGRLREVWMYCLVGPRISRYASFGWSNHCRGRELRMFLASSAPGSDFCGRKLSRCTPGAFARGVLREAGNRRGGI